jgi:4-amino-4-deoxy-L-arabinose transferase-like glycosyltransferase
VPRGDTERRDLRLTADHHDSGQYSRNGSDGVVNLPPILTLLRAKILVFLAAVGLVLSSWVVIPDRYFLSHNTDYEGYFLPVAKNLLHGHGFTWHGPPGTEGIPSGYFSPPPAPGMRFTIFPPAYVLMVAAAVAIAERLHFPEIYAVDALNVLAIGLCAVSLFSIAAAVFGWRRALLAPLFCVTYPGILLATKGGNHELQFCAAVLGAVALLWRGVQCSHRRRLVFFAAGLLFGCAMLLRAQAIVLLPACMIWLLLFPRQARLRWRLRWAAITVFASLLVILPWEVWLYARLGRVVPTSTDGPAAIAHGLAFAMASGPTNGQPADGVPDEVKRLSAGFLTECGRSPSSAQIIAFVRTQLRIHPKRAAEFFLIKVLRSWYATTSGRLDHDSLVLHLAYGLLFTSILAIALRRAGPPRLLATLVLSIVLSTWALTVVVLSIVRYMMPAITILFVLTPALIGRQPEE